MSVLERTLHIDSPLFLLQAECLQSSFLAKSLGLVYVLVAAIVSRPGVTFRIFVYLFKSVSALTSPMQDLFRLTLHDTAQRIENCL